ncbi:alkane hydroxylase MAH1-like protein [Cinnamomum micranthum f. kanehirae]|uniref:Alkane hydroxylase MAH1-like protein n=1 Tax=Cinnamomum micranthum f. kanehirae TaxID=337451 RepID=A0A443N6Y8_9MAGN|nr:alkane hydroxylase MAH1-like protein [Cinnamomum micranthum f. kanehirae]
MGLFPIGPSLECCPHLHSTSIECTIGSSMYSGKQGAHSCSMVHGSPTWTFSAPATRLMSTTSSVPTSLISPKGPSYSKIFDVLGGGIFNSDSESWRIQRKMAHSLISSKRFGAFVARTSQEKVDKGLVHVLKHIIKHGQGIIDLQDVFQRFSFDSTCILVFGVDPGSLAVDFPTVPFAKAMDDAMEAVAFRHAMPESWWMLLKWLNIGWEKKLAEGWKIIDQFINQHISTRREALHKSKTQGVESDCEGEDLLTAYINYQPGDELAILNSAKFLRDTTVNLMLAGRDTTGAALTWFFWVVSMNPEVETKILQELKATSPKLREGWHGKLKVFDAEELSQLVFLHAALCESLRLFPPVPFEHKSVFQPQVLPTGETVLPETKILIPLYAMGRMESIWGKDCLEFKPERWISERGKLKFEPSYKFMAFNSGPRNCLGKEVAFTQMKTVAAALLLNFHIQVLEGHPVSPKVSIILHMKNGLMVRVRERYPDAMK